MPAVADLLVAGLRRAGVPRLFGVPGGGSNLELLEAARVQGLPFVLAHQEWAACIMAAVTGELTGVPGAALSTLGPGVTASATGLAYPPLRRARPRGPARWALPAAGAGRGPLPVAARVTPPPPARPSDAALERAAALLR